MSIKSLGHLLERAILPNLSPLDDGKSFRTYLKRENVKQLCFLSIKVVFSTKLRHFSRTIGGRSEEMCCRASLAMERDSAYPIEFEALPMHGFINQKFVSMISEVRLNLGVRQMKVTMNVNVASSIVVLRRRFAQAASVLLFMGVMWQSMALGANASSFLNQNGAAPMVAASTNSMAKQVSGKVDRIKGAAEESMGRADQIKGAAKESMGRAQSKMEDKGGDVKRNMKKSVKATKTAVDNTASKAGDSAGNAVDAVKDFFGQ